MSDLDDLAEAYQARKLPPKPRRLHRIRYVFVGIVIGAGATTYVVSVLHPEKQSQMQTADSASIAKSPPVTISEPVQPAKILHGTAPDSDTASFSKCSVEHSVSPLDDTKVTLFSIEAQENVRWERPIFFLQLSGDTWNAWVYTGTPPVEAPTYQVYAPAVVRFGSQPARRQLLAMTKNKLGLYLVGGAKIFGPLDSLVVQYNAERTNGVDMVFDLRGLKRALDSEVPGWESVQNEKFPTRDDQVRSAMQ